MNVVEHVLDDLVRRWCRRIPDEKSISCAVEILAKPVNECCLVGRVESVVTGEGGRMIQNAYHACDVYD